MVCIYCGGKTRVNNSRHQKKSNQVWRRRECLECESIITTQEQIEPTTSLLFVKSTNKTEPFSRDILLFSVYDSLKHRKTAMRDATALTNTIWSKILKHINNASIKRESVIKETTKVLSRFDKASAVQYSAYHPL